MGLWRNLQAEVYSRFMARAAVRSGSLGTQKSVLWDELFKRGMEALLVQNEVTNPVGQVDTVYIAINRIARYGASVDWRLFNGKTPLEQPDHPFYVLMRKPNEFTIGTQLIERTLQHLEAYGACFWWPNSEARMDKRLPAKFPTRIDVLDNPNKVKPTIEGGRMTGWEYDPTDGKPSQKFGLQDLVPFLYPDPTDQRKWLSPLSAARLGYNLAWKSSRWQELFFQNGGVPPFWMYTPPDTAIDEDEIERLRQQFKDRFLGLRNAGTPPILFRGAELRPLTVNQRDTEWLATQKLTREQILGIYDVPPSIAGVFEYANYANAAEQKRYFWCGTLPPKHALMKSVIQAYLVDRYFPGTAFDWLWQDKLSKVLPEDTHEGIKSARSLVEIGVPPSEAFRMLGVPVDTGGREWLDEGYMVFNLMPVDLIKEARAAAPPEGDAGGGDTSDSSEATSSPEKGMDHPIRNILRAKYEKIFIRLEDRYLRDYRGFLNWLKSSIHGAAAQVAAYQRAPLSKGAEEQFIPPLRRITDEVQRRVKAATTLAIREGLQSAAAEIGVEFSFDHLDPAIIQLLLNRQQSIIGATDTIVQALRAQVAIGIGRGESVDQIATRLRMFMDEYYEGQAITVARTETAAAFVNARIAQMQRAGVPKTMWLTARDERVRRTHAHQEGMIRILGQEFPNKCRWPHDERGEASEVVGCRCVPLPVFEKEG